MAWVIVDSATRVYERDANHQERTPVGAGEELVEVSTYPYGPNIVLDKGQWREPLQAEVVLINQHKADAKERIPIDPHMAALLQLLAVYTSQPVTKVRRDYLLLL